MNTYTVRFNLQGGIKPEKNNNINVSNKKLIPIKSHKKKSRNKIEPKSINNSSKNWSPEDKTDILIKRFKIASKTNDVLKSSTNKESELNKNTLKVRGMKKKNNRPSNVKNNKVKKRQKTFKVVDTKTNDENNRKFVTNKAENQTPVNEQGSRNEKNWRSDEKTERNSELRDMKFEKETSHYKEDDIQDEPHNIKTVNTGENYGGDDRKKRNQMIGIKKKTIRVQSMKVGIQCSVAEIKTLTSGIKEIIAGIEKTIIGIVKKTVEVKKERGIKKITTERTRKKIII